MLISTGAMSPCSPQTATAPVVVKFDLVLSSIVFAGLAPTCWSVVGSMSVKAARPGVNPPPGMGSGGEMVAENDATVRGGLTCATSAGEGGGLVQAASRPAVHAKWRIRKRIEGRVFDLSMGGCNSYLARSGGFEGLPKPSTARG